MFHRDRLFKEKMILHNILQNIAQCLHSFIQLRAIWVNILISSMLAFAHLHHILCDFCQYLYNT